MSARAKQSRISPTEPLYLTKSLMRLMLPSRLRRDENDVLDRMTYSYALPSNNQTNIMRLSKSFSLSSMTLD